jgi:hypothetical protein
MIWLLANWKSAVVGTIILVMGVYIGFLQLNVKRLTFNNESLKLELRVKEEEIESWKKLYQILGDKLAEQNKSIVILKNKTETAKQARVAADKKAASIGEQARAKENALQKHSASNGTCESELQTIKSMLDAAI